MLGTKNEKKIVMKRRSATVISDIAAEVKNDGPVIFRTLDDEAIHKEF